MEAFQFDPRKKGRTYSKGNRQKVALIAAFAVPAELYIFDEPTSGLDPLMEVMFRREVAVFKALNRIPGALGPRIPRPLRHPLRSLLPR